MIATIKNPHIQTLCKLAQEDESTLQFPLPDQIYGFHAQQSCEKLFKALIAANNRAYPFTHSLEQLSEILAECGESLPSVPYDPIQLEPFAVELRYDLGGTLSDEEKAEILKTVETLREYVVGRVLELETGAPTSGKS